MKTEELCPICNARGVLVSAGAFGWLCHCSDCFDGDPESDRWRTLQGHGATEHEAVEKWLEEAREVAAIDEIPNLTISYRPTEPTLVLDVMAQAIAEFALQGNFDLVPGWRWVPDATNQDGRRAEDVFYVEYPE